MHMVIDILAAIVLLFFLLAGWHKGFLLSLLGVVRVFFAYAAAFYAGRYIGFWLAETAYRPKIVMMPVVAGLTFTLISLNFHIIMSRIRAHRQNKEEQEDYRHSFFSCLGGSAINLIAGALSLIILFWLGDLFMVGATGTGIPGADKSKLGHFVRLSVYETALYIIPDRDNPSQASSIARMISNPTDAMVILERIVTAESIQELANDEELPGDLLSGNAERIGQNPSIQKLFSDRVTLEDLRDLGVLSGHETRSGLCNKLAAFGQNETIRTSVENLKARDMLTADKIPLLVRDPDFDTIIAELLK
jgi:uncharacterized membrane protein required for colicin V production